MIIFTNGTAISFPLLLGGVTSLTTGLLGFGSIFNFFPVGFGRSFADSTWETHWADLSGLFEMEHELHKTKYISDEEERLACFSWILCSHQRNSNGSGNVLLILLR